MRDREVPATLERTMAFLAAITLLAGTAVLGLVGWTTLGWVMVGYGLAMFVMAYLFAVAPEGDDL